MAVSKLAIVAAAAMVCVGSFASASVIYLRSVNSTYGGNAVTVTTFDDAMLNTSTSGAGGTTVNNSSNTTVRTLATGVVDVGILGIKDLFVQLPRTSGGTPITIESATLHLYSNGSFNGDAGSAMSVYRVTTDWMPAAAGQNQLHVSGRWAVNNAVPQTPWLSMSGTSFGTSDYTTANSVTQTWLGGTNVQNNFNVTGIVQAIYADGLNYGFAFKTSSTTSQSFRSAENTANITPVLEITYSVPEPAALGLLGVSAIGLIMGRRRRVEG